MSPRVQYFISGFKYVGRLWFGGSDMDRCWRVYQRYIKW